MRLRNIKNADEIIRNSSYVIDDPSTYKGHWNNIFNNNNPIYVEIGMGKGQFIIENAIRFPNINFIGIEKFSTVMVKAIKKIADMDIPNLKLICIDALNIENIFNNEIELLYLNFSDPWPKERHARRRLTSDIFLNLYEKIFKNNYNIIMKTDNILLYNFSKDQFVKHDYDIICSQFDINNMPETNIMTEYEEKFLNNNEIIYRIEASKNKKIV